MLLAAVMGTLLLGTAGRRTIRLKLNNAVQPKMANPPPVKSNANGESLTPYGRPEGRKTGPAVLKRLRACFCRNFG